MFLDELRQLPDSVVKELDPDTVQQYLVATGWVWKEVPDQRVSLYHRPESEDEQVLLPAARELRDFTPRMAEAVVYIAEHENRSALEVLKDLLAADTDILRFRESSRGAERGEILLDHGVALLRGIRQSLLAAACSLLRPRETYHPRMSLNEASRFVRDCRLGQTERGSYVVTVSSPLEAVTGQLFESQPFPRLAVQELMRSTTLIALAAQTQDPVGYLESAQEDHPGRPRPTANLCEALLEMAPQDEEATLTITASYSVKIPVPRDVVQPRIVELRGEMVPRIEEMANRLRPVDPAEPQHLVGFVETLNGRPNADNLTEGPVVLRLIGSDWGRIRARVLLPPREYQVAVTAHASNIPVRLTGVLGRVGKRFEITRLDRIQMLIV